MNLNYIEFLSIKFLLNLSRDYHGSSYHKMISIDVLFQIKHRNFHLMINLSKNILQSFKINYIHEHININSLIFLQFI